MSEDSENVLAHLEGSSQDERFEIAVRPRADSLSPVVSIKQQAWGTGIGWFTQSAVELPPSSLIALKRALCLAPAAIRQTAFTTNSNLPESEEAPTVIPFPGLASGTNKSTTTED